ncbi:MAG: response regulator transcription factor [Actinomycetota bacterium]
MAPSPAAPSTPVRVVVVDDQPVYQEAARFVIELSDGFELVGVAATGEEGVWLVDRLTPDLVLMDVNLPGIDGLEATRQIAADHPATGIIVFSTHAARDVADRAVSAGAIGFIPKAELAPDRLSRTWNDRPGQG